MEMINVVAVVGPTASGKTRLAVELAKAFDGEIVSADSMQIYRGMDIATAKPSEDEKQGIAHHMMDFLSPDQNYSVAQFCDGAHRAIREIHERKKLPIIAGGTGLYVNSLLKNISFSENDGDEAIRKELYDLLEEKGLDTLLGIVKEIDPDSFERLKVERNPKRVVRCLEVYRCTGETQTQINRRQNEAPALYRPLKIGLKAADREVLYERINARVDQMAQNGLIEEAKTFLFDPSLSDTASMAIGYKELKPYFDGEKPLEVCLANLKMQTRRYAKRQLTWFLRDSETHWFDIDLMCFEEIVEQSKTLIRNEGFA